MRNAALLTTTAALVLAYATAARAQFDGARGADPLSPQFLSLKVAMRPSAPSSRKEGPASPFVVPFHFTVTDTLRARYGEAAANRVAAIAELSSQLTKSSQPNRDNIFTWTSSRAALKNKELGIVLALSTDPSLPPEIQDPRNSNSSADSLTAFIRTDEDGKHLILLYLFADRIIFDDGGSTRSDALVRMTVAMAHSLYGNVQDFLTIALDPAAPGAVLIDARTQQRGTFQAGIDFLQRFMQSKLWDTYTQRTKDSFNAALERERKALKSWQ